MLEEGSETESKRRDRVELVELYRRMISEIKIKDRKYRFKTYPRCFLGKDAVAWLRKNISKEKVDVQKAIEIGNEMMTLRLFRHVTNEHLLEDAKLYYYPCPSIMPLGATAPILVSFLSRLYAQKS